MNKILKKGDLIYNKNYKSFMIFIDYSPNKKDVKDKKFVLAFHENEFIVIKTKNTIKVENDTKI